MEHDTEITSASSDLRLFQGLIENEGRSYSNWGLHRTTTPAVFAEPITYADVQALVRDTTRFPTPVNPVGSMMSVSSTFVNDGGTIVCLRKLDEVIGIERDAAGREVVRVQAGCRLKKLNSRLQARGLEIPFQAEIGEATVGSVAAGDTKESSLDGPGYFSAHVVAVTCVDENGILRTLSDQKDGAAFYEFKCSFGLSGIIVECLVETRPATLCRSDVSVEAFATPAELAAALLAKRSASDALLAIVFLDQLASFFDQRFKAGPGGYTPAASQPECDAYRLAKRLAIQHGFDGVEVPQPKGIVYSRADFVNEYWRPYGERTATGLSVLRARHLAGGAGRDRDLRLLQNIQGKNGIWAWRLGNLFRPAAVKRRKAVWALFRRGRTLLFLRSNLLKSCGAFVAAVFSRI